LAAEAQKARWRESRRTLHRCTPRLAAARRRQHATRAPPAPAAASCGLYTRAYACS